MKLAQFCANDVIIDMWHCVIISPPRHNLTDILVSTFQARQHGDKCTNINLWNSKSDSWLIHIQCVSQKNPPVRGP